MMTERGWISGSRLSLALRRGVVAASLLSLAVPTGAFATEGPVSLEGVWRNTAPQASLAPVAGSIPFTAEGRKAYQKNKSLKARRAYDDYDIATSRCSNPGVPRLMLTAQRFKIWQQQGVVTFDFEWNRAIRQIDVRNVPTEPPLVPTASGVSKGHWEGDTLVSVTTDASERALIDDTIPRTSATKVTERIRLSGTDTLEVRVTIEDPALFSRPWESVITFQRQPDAAFPEDICMDRLEAKQPAFSAS